jgi:hypothetical protein
VDSNVSEPVEIAFIIVSPFVYEMQQPSQSDSRFPIKFMLISLIRRRRGPVLSGIGTRFITAF